jgi:hypothetical protein
MTDLVELLRDPGSCKSWEHADRQRERAADEIERLRSECDALRKDADRYRWLRQQGWGHRGMCVAEKSSSIRLGYGILEFEQLDAAIDAARKGIV